MLSRSSGECSNTALLRQLEQPFLTEIHAVPGHQLTKSLPRYIAKPVTMPELEFSSQQWHAELVDLGLAFPHSRPPNECRTPLVYRAPEALLDATWDHRIDIWALGCAFFELVTGWPPFEYTMPLEDGLIGQWMDKVGPLPPEWKVPPTAQQSEFDPMNIAEWLRESYYDGHRDTDLAEEHIECLGDLLSSMMRYRPDERPSTRDILKHQWFAKDPLSI